MKAKRQPKRPEDINATLAAKKEPISRWVARHYRHFNAAALLDAAKGYEAHLGAGVQMLITLAGAMFIAELGLSLVAISLKSPARRPAAEATPGRSRMRKLCKASSSRPRRNFSSKAMR